MDFWKRFGNKPSATLNWLDDTSFEIDGYKITLDYAHGGSRRDSSAKNFTVMKERHFFEHYTALRPEDCRKVLELGIYQGGSFVFLDRFLKPDRISALDLTATPIPSLDEYVARNNDGARIYYGYSQDDEAKLKEIIDKDFRGVLDLVIDDASHWYEQTKASFRTVFPHLRPGGTYIIEDWSWSFQADFQKPDNDWFNRASLANLVIDLMEDMIVGPMIEDVYVSRPLIKIKRSGASGGTVLGKQACRGRSLGLL